MLDATPLRSNARVFFETGAFIVGNGPQLNPLGAGIGLPATVPAVVDIAGPGPFFSCTAFRCLAFPPLERELPPADGGVPGEVVSKLNASADGCDQDDSILGLAGMFGKARDCLDEDEDDVDTITDVLSNGSFRAASKICLSFNAARSAFNAVAAVAATTGVIARGRGDGDCSETGEKRCSPFTTCLRDDVEAPRWSFPMRRERFESTSSCCPIAMPIFESVRCILSMEGPLGITLSKRVTILRGQESVTGSQVVPFVQDGRVS